jgi:hypothetical protein
MGSKLTIPQLGSIELPAVSSGDVNVSKRLCAIEVHWARNAIRSSSGYTQSSDAEKANFDKHLEAFELVLAQCVDSAVKPESYRIYSKIQDKMDKGEAVDANAEEKRIHRTVSDLLAD